MHKEKRMLRAELRKGKVGWGTLPENSLPKASDLQYDPAAWTAGVRGKEQGMKERWEVPFCIKAFTERCTHALMLYF